MLHLESLRISDLVYPFSANPASGSIAESTTPVPVPVLRVICLAGSFCGAHDAGEEADKHHTDGGKAGTDDADVDLDCRPRDYIDLVPGWVDGGGEVDKRLKAKARHNRDTELS